MRQHNLADSKFILLKYCCPASVNFSLTLKKKKKKKKKKPQICCSENASFAFDQSPNICRLALPRIFPLYVAGLQINSDFSLSQIDLP